MDPISNNGFVKKGVNVVTPPLESKYLKNF